MSYPLLTTRGRVLVLIAQEGPLTLNHLVAMTYLSHRSIEHLVSELSSLDLIVRELAPSVEGWWRLASNISVEEALIDDAKRH